MRVKISKTALNKLFLSLKIHSNVGYIAKKLGVSTRVISDWRRGVSSMPISALNLLAKEARIDWKSLSPKILEDFWHTGLAGKKGGIARTALYGNFGTPDGRRKGGKKSIKSHRTLNTRFKIRKKVKMPAYSGDLAELLGVFIGDGHLSYYQALVTTNSKTDSQHASFVASLIKNLFGVNARISCKKKENTINVVASSVEVVRHLSRLGMPMGNKLNAGLTVPQWIMNSQYYQQRFIRGLFDTDGCVYIDTHKTSAKTYRHLCWTITSYADTLIAGVVEILQKMKFSPTNRKSQRSVYLRKQKEIHRYFKEVGTSNPKHSLRYAMIKKE